jgi:hypothetical protein
MGIIAWIILGLVAGFIGSKLVNKRGEGLVLDMVLGIIGAFVGGFIFTHFFDASRRAPDLPPHRPSSGDLVDCSGRNYRKCTLKHRAAYKRAALLFT